jgi:hypothetical protein
MPSMVVVGVVVVARVRGEGKPEMTEGGALCPLLLLLLGPTARPIKTAGASVSSDGLGLLCVPCGERERRALVLARARDNRRRRQRRSRFAARALAHKTGRPLSPRPSLSNPQSRVVLCERAPLHPRITFFATPTGQREAEQNHPLLHLQRLSLPTPPPLFSRARTREATQSTQPRPLD